MSAPIVSSVLLGLLMLGCAGERQLANGTERVAQRLRAARDAGAEQCAPRALAIGESSLEFVRIELRQGSLARAREHLRDADEHASAALRASEAEACVRRRTPGPVAAVGFAQRIRSVGGRLLLDGEARW